MSMVVLTRSDYKGTCSPHYACLAVLVTATLAHLAQHLLARVGLAEDLVCLEPSVRKDLIVSCKGFHIHECKGATKQCICGMCIIMRMRSCAARHIRPGRGNTPERGTAMHKYTVHAEWSESATIIATNAATARKCSHRSAHGQHVPHEPNKRTQLQQAVVLPANFCTNKSPYHQFRCTRQEQGITAPGGLSIMAVLEHFPVFTRLINIAGGSRLTVYGPSTSICACCGGTAHRATFTTFNSASWCGCCMSGCIPGCIPVARPARRRG